MFKEPQEIVLSQRAEYRNIRGRQKLRIVKETFQYIPILKTLEALLNQPDVIEEVILLSFFYCFLLMTANTPTLIFCSVAEIVIPSSSP